MISFLSFPVLISGFWSPHYQALAAYGCCMGVVLLVLVVVIIAAIISAVKRKRVQ